MRAMMVKAHTVGGIPSRADVAVLGFLLRDAFHKEKKTNQRGCASSEKHATPHNAREVSSLN
jgi:hypothetical protein